MRKSTVFTIVVCLFALPVAAQVTYTTIARTGQVVPQTDGLLSFRFSSGVINNSGEVAAILSYDRSSIKQAVTLFPSPGVYNPIAIQKNPAPGTDDAATFGSSFSNLTLNDPGQVFFRNNLTADISKDEALFTTPSPLSDIAISMFLTAREGNAAPGLPAGTVYTRVGADNLAFIPTAMGDGGHVAYVSGLSGGGTVTTTQHALFAGLPSGPGLVVRQGEPTSSPGLNFDVPSNLNINPSGRLAFRSSLRSSTTLYPNSGIFIANPDGVTGAYSIGKVASRGDNPPGSAATFLTFSAPSINPAGDVAFMGEAGVVAANQYLLVGRPGKLVTVAHTGEPIVGNSSTPLIADRFSDPLLSTNGAVTFQASIGGVDAGHNAALFSGLPGNLHMIAREGDPTPADPDTFFGDLLVQNNKKFATNGHGQVVFAATLTGTGTQPATSQAIFGTDRAGQLMLLARYGQTYDAGDGAGPRIAGSFSTSFSSNGADGLSSTFNDQGQFVYTLIFDSGTANETSALVRAQIPFPGDATGDGLVNSADFKALYRNFDKPGTQSTGDFNHDGMTNFADFQLMERWFGQSSDSAPVAVSPADRAALSAFANTVPEPTAILPLLATLLLLRPRPRRRAAFMSSSQI